MTIIKDKVVAATGWSKGGHGEYPCRYVVCARQTSKGETEEYARFMQVKDGKHKDYFIYGHYYGTFHQALADMEKSFKENNRDYGPGNVSHMAKTGGFVRKGPFPMGTRYKQ